MKLINHTIELSPLITSCVRIDGTSGQLMLTKQQLSQIKRQLGIMGNNVNSPYGYNNNPNSNYSNSIGYFNDGYEESEGATTSRSQVGIAIDVNAKAALTARDNSSNSLTANTFNTNVVQQHPEAGQMSFGMNPDIVNYLNNEINKLRNKFIHRDEFENTLDIAKSSSFAANPFNATITTGKQ